MKRRPKISLTTVLISAVFFQLCLQEQSTSTKHNEGTLSPECVNSPRHNTIIRHQFVPDVLQRNPIAADLQTSPRQPDVVTVFSSTEGLSINRTYGTDHTFQPSSASDNTILYQNYDAANTDA